LENITVDGRNPSYASIEGILFDKNIKTIIQYPIGKKAEIYSIPSSVTTIGNYAFVYCKNLTSVTIPSSVTTIGSFAFSRSGLTSVTMSRRTQIGNSVFPDTAKIIYRD